MRAESGLVVTAEQDVAEVGLMTVRLVAVRLKMMRLGRKLKNCLRLKIRLNRTFLLLELG